MSKLDFKVVEEFEKQVAKFFGALYGVATDSATHAIELCLRYTKAKYINCPKHTYLSVPMLANKLGIDLRWTDEEWVDYYNLTHIVIDAAVLWRKDSYLSETMMCVSMQYQKHLSVGRLGVILLDDKKAAMQLKKMSYDGRIPNIPWREQNVDTFGFHYYAQPELCQLALDKLQKAIDTKPRQWVYTDWNDLTQMKVFKR